MREALIKAWPLYFPDEEDSYNEKDGRAQVIDMLISFLRNDGNHLLAKSSSDCSALWIDHQQLVECCPLDDFESCLFNRPEDVIACLGISVFVIYQQNNPDRGKISIRLFNVLPLIPISSLKANFMSNFVSVTGTVIRVTGVRPLVLSCDFLCSRCGAVCSQPFKDGKYEPPLTCLNSPCKSKNFILDRSTATTVDFQCIRIQELDTSQADAGRIPRAIDIELTEDLVDVCIPGDVVIVSGIVKSMQTDAGKGVKKSQASALYTLYIYANSVVSTKETMSGNLRLLSQLQTSEFTPQELTQIKEIAQLDHVFDRIVHSLSPGIYGNNLVKAGLILSLFGGTKKQEENDDFRPRGDSHLLIVGDPGLGKSQLLRAVTQLAPRAVYICGNTTTTTGLTVTMVRDSTNGYALEAGALVLADQGICCIDEFDKMGIDYEALLEAMEQQSISIAKAGVVCTLSARTSIIAAANPVGGHYNRSKSVSENLKMKAALLSRFDLVFILLDRSDEERDRILSEHVTKQHTAKGRLYTKNSFLSRENVEQEDREQNSDLSQDQLEWEVSLSLLHRLRDNSNKYTREAIEIPLLRKYISYARKYVNPTLSNEAKQVLQDLYLKMRSGDFSHGNIPITTRQLESLIRLSQARAKVELREVVNEKDALEVVEIMEESLLECLTMDSGELEFGQRGGLSLTKKVKAFVSKLSKVTKERSSNMFTFQELLEIANRMALEIEDFRDFLDILRNQCYLLQKGPNLFQVQVLCSTF